MNNKPRGSMRAAINAFCKAVGCESKVLASGYCNAHYLRMRRTGDANSPRKRRPRGSGTLHSDGYRKIGEKYEHIAIAECALGRPLPPKAQVHHVNGDRSDNRPSNLVICPDGAYHGLLHRRSHAIEQCGHADWVKCGYCHKWDKPERMANRSSNGGVYHRECGNEYQRIRQEKLRKARKHAQGYK